MTPRASPRARSASESRRRPATTSPASRRQTLTCRSTRCGWAAPPRTRWASSSRPADTGGKLRLSASCSCYYRRLPTWEEQVGYLGDRLGAAEEYPLAPVFQRVPAETGPVTVAVPAGGLTRRDEGTREFDAAFAQVRDTALADPRVERRQGDERRERLVPAEAMRDQAAFEEWLRKVNTGDPVVPQLRRADPRRRPPRSGRGYG